MAESRIDEMDIPTRAVFYALTGLALLCIVGAVTVLFVSYSSPAGAADVTATETPEGDIILTISDIPEHYYTIEVNGPDGTVQSPEYTNNSVTIQDSQRILFENPPENASITVTAKELASKDPVFGVRNETTVLYNSTNA